MISAQNRSECLHGIKFEDTAQKIYEHLTNTKVGEYGCIRHKTIHHLGASPDGIVIECDDPKLAGRMLEIKCLYSRKLTGIPLYKYWVQCQLQMEVCNLEYCDFFECKIDETLSDTEFYKVIEKKSANFYGLMIEYTNTDNGEKIMYKYAKMNESEGDPQILSRIDTLRIIHSFLPKNSPIMASAEKKLVLDGILASASGGDVLKELENEGDFEAAMDKLTPNDSIFYSIGTSCIFAFVMLSIAGWFFCRKDL